jgi:hypothetical protein
MGKFALQGVDGKWYWATAVIDGKDASFPHRK